jgi:ATP-binding cassette, subfamily C, bacteriocin exporter
MVAVVPQEIDLFAGNVIDNVAVGEMEPDMRKLLAVCERLGVTEFVEKMPQGFHTYLGENGVALSGGQRQRLAIARAFLKDPPILILDEATSDLDAESEFMVQQALADLMHGRTVLVIAHRLATVRNADRIVVVHEGRIAEIGRHDELLARDGVYRRLHALQMEGLTA